MKVNTSTLGDKKFASRTSLPPYQLNCLPLWLHCPINTESASQSKENVWRLKTLRISNEVIPLKVEVQTVGLSPDSIWKAWGGGEQQNTVLWFSHCSAPSSRSWKCWLLTSISLRLESGRMSHFLSRKELSIHLQALLFFQALGFDF